MILLSFFARPITNQIQQLELNLIHSDQVAMTAKQQKSQISDEPNQSDSEINVTRFNTVLPIVNSEENFTVNFATTVQNYLGFVLLINAFIASSLILPALYFVQKSHSF